MAVGEAVEAGGRAARVGAHVLEVEPVAHVERGAEAGALRDAVDAVARRAPERVGDGGAVMVARGLAAGRVALVLVVVAAVVSTDQWVLQE